MTMRQTGEGLQTPVVNTVVSAMAILECFTPRETELRLSQLCERTGFYKSRTHRLCATLIGLGYLVKTARNCYRLGPKLLVLGKAYESSKSLRSLAQPVMQTLSAATGVSSTLYVLNGIRCICLAREMGPSRLVFGIQEGDVEELYTMAAGRALLAYQSSEFIARVLTAATTVQFTPNTLVDKAVLREELARIRTQGYAVNNQEREIGIAAIGAPIFNRDGQVTSALSIAGPVHRFTPEAFADQLLAIRSAATEMAEIFKEA